MNIIRRLTAVLTPLLLLVLLSGGTLINPFWGAVQVTVAPAFVNAGTVLNNGTASSATPTLPGSRSSGNVLLAVVVSRSSGTHATATACWTKIGSDIVGGSGGNQTRMGIFRCTVDGSETAPTITGTAGSNIARIFQWSGSTASPIGATDSGSGSGTTVSDGGVNSTANYSRVIYIAGMRGGTLGTPSGYGENSDGGTTNGCAIAVGGADITTSGSASGSISATATVSAAWALATIELKAN